MKYENHHEEDNLCNNLHNLSLCYGDQDKGYMKIKYQWEGRVDVYFHIHLAQNDGQSD